MFSSLSFIFSVVFPLVLEKLVILIGSRAPIVSYATHFNIFSKKPVFSYLGPFSKALVGPNISLFCQENGVGTHFEQQFFHVDSMIMKQYSFNVFNFLSDHQIGNLIVCR